MSFELMQRCFDLRAADLSSAEKSVLVGLARYANNDGTNSYPSIPTLAACTCLNHKTVRSALSSLVDKGYASAVVRAGASTVFSISLEKLPTTTKNGSTEIGTTENGTTKNGTPTPPEIGSTTPTKNGMPPLPNLGGKYINKKPLNKPTEEVSPRPRDFVPEEVERGEARKQRKPKAQRTKLPYDTIPLQWWIECDKLRPKTFNPWVVFEEFKRYWLSDDAVGKGLKKSWLATWRNHVKNLRQNDANRWQGFNGEYQTVFERLYRGTLDEKQAEAFFADKTSIHDFGHGDLAGFDPAGDLFDAEAEARADAEALASVRALMRSGKSCIGILKNQPAAEEEWDACF